MTDELTKINRLESPTLELDSLRVGGVTVAPNEQMDSLKQVRYKLGNRSNKNFRFKKVIGRGYFTITRTK